MGIENLDERKMAELVERVVERLAPAMSRAGGQSRGGDKGPVTNPRATPAPGEVCGPSPALVSRNSGSGARASSAGRARLGIHDDVDSAVAAARQSHEHIVHRMTMGERDRLIAAVRAAVHHHVNELSESAVAETGLGRVADKINKNLLVADKTPGTEILRPWCQTGDDGLVLMERAPFGVIGAITPTTNPTETIICNGIGFLAGGNGMVFNVHPSAKKVCRRLIEILNQAILDAGGPDNVFNMIGDPTIESANALMTHPGVRVVVVTGGPGVVKAAMQSGKRAICGGPGNPPVVVDETADIRVAANGIIRGHSLDNNIVCIAEKEIFCVSDVADALKREMVSTGGAVELTAAEIAKLVGVVVDKDGVHPAKEWVGKDASKIADAIGKRVPKETRLLLCEVDDENHPFIQNELLMPVLGMVRVPNVDVAIDAAVRAEHGFGHTASMYSTNIDTMHQMARAFDGSIFIKNAPTYAGLGLGGEGYTSFTIASPTGEGLTNATHFTRERRCTLKDRFRIV